VPGKIEIVTELLEAAAATPAVQSAGRAAIATGEKLLEGCSLLRTIQTVAIAIEKRVDGVLGASGESKTIEEALTKPGRFTYDQLTNYLHSRMKRLGINPDDIPLSHPETQTLFLQTVGRTTRNLSLSDDFTRSYSHYAFLFGQMQDAGRQYTTLRQAMSMEFPELSDLNQLAWHGGRKFLARKAEYKPLLEAHDAFSHGFAALPPVEQDISKMAADRMQPSINQFTSAAGMPNIRLIITPPWKSMRGGYSRTNYLKVNLNTLSSASGQRAVAANYHELTHVEHSLTETWAAADLLGIGPDISRAELNALERHINSSLADTTSPEQQNGWSATSLAYRFYLEDAMRLRNGVRLSRAQTERAAALREARINYKSPEEDMHAYINNRLEQEAFFTEHLINATMRHAPQLLK